MAEARSGREVAMKRHLGITVKLKNGAEGFDYCCDLKYNK